MSNRFNLLKKKIKRYLTLFSDYNLIKKSQLFNKDWYINNNPDVASKKLNPLLHFLQYGGLEGRDPNPNFSSKWYLETYQDVKQSLMNPLVHYIRFGKNEGRLPNPSQLIIDSISNTLKLTNSNFNLSSNKLKKKVFCIGYNKTGTTSIGRALQELGYKLGDQSVGEQLMDDWAIRDFRSIIQYCTSADAFQDLPFSIDFTYQILDFVFPNSKFILTIRNNSDEWFDSLIRFYKKLMKIDRTPTAKDMINFPYGGAGWFWRQEQNIFGIDEANVCNKEIYVSHYNTHNERVLEYFKFRKNDLLVLNLANTSAMQSLCEFLGIEYAGQVMPHLNKSS